MPANSDYAPVLDLNAARHRFMEKSATDVVALLNAELPLLEMLERERSRRAVNPLYKGAYAFDRIENTRLAWYARDFLLRAGGAGARVGAARAAEGPRARQAAPDRVPRAARARCLAAQRAARGEGAQSLPRARRPRAGVGAHHGKRLLRRAAGFPAPLARALSGRGRAQRRAHGRARRAAHGRGAAAGRGRARVPVAGGDDRLRRERRKSESARGVAHLWPGSRAPRPAFRLLRCHAEAAGCADAFRAYAER